MALAILALLAGAQFAAGASEESITFYLQLVQGTDADTPPATGATLVGSRLGRRLQMFRWRNYWEVKRQTVQLKAGATARRHMTHQRDVEIALTTHNKHECLHLRGWEVSAKKGATCRYSVLHRRWAERRGATVVHRRAP